MIPIKNPKNAKLGGSSYFGKNVGSSVRSAAVPANPRTAESEM